MIICYSQNSTMRPCRVDGGRDDKPEAFASPSVPCVAVKKASWSFALRIRCYHTAMLAKNSARTHTMHTIQMPWRYLGQ